MLNSCAKFVQNFFAFYRFFQDSPKMKNDRKRGHIKGFGNVNPNRSYVSGVPGETRTPDRRLRRPLLYPAELLGHNQDDTLIFLLPLPLPANTKKPDASGQLATHSKMSRSLLYPAELLGRYLHDIHDKIKESG